MVFVNEAGKAMRPALDDNEVDAEALGWNLGQAGQMVLDIPSARNFFP